MYFVKYAVRKASHHLALPAMILALAQMIAWVSIGGSAEPVVALFIAFALTATAQFMHIIMYNRYLAPAMVIGRVVGWMVSGTAYAMAAYLLVVMTADIQPHTRSLPAIVWFGVLCSVLASFVRIGYVCYLDSRGHWKRGYSANGASHQARCMLFISGITKSWN